MNIGLFTDTYFPQINGVATSTYTLAKNLRKMGHNVYIFTPQDPKNKDENEFNVIRMPSMPCIFIHQYRIGLLYPPKEFTEITKLQLDVIHTQTEFSLGMFGKSLSKFLGVPIVHTYHTMYEDYVHYIVNGALITPSMAHSFSRIFCNFALSVVAPTQKVKDCLLDYGVTKPISVIPTGINIDKFRKSNYSFDEINELRKSFGLDQKNKVILVLGRIAKEKSIDVILNAMPSVLKKEPLARLLIVGDGPYRQNLEELSKTIGISEEVIFAGARPWEDIGRYYQLGDVFVSASVSETQGLTFIEAMAASLPVVAKNDDCIKGVIENGKTGLVFDSDEFLPEKIIEIFENNALKEKLSKNGRDYSESLSEESFAKSILNLYTKVISDYKELQRAHSKRRSIIRLAEYEYIRIKHFNRKIKKIASSPAKAVKKYIDKNENGGN